MKNIIRKKVLLVTLAMYFCTGSAFALPKDPDNAALLYYQAFCVYEKPDKSMKDMIAELAKGYIEPNPTIIEYIEGCRPALKLAESAAELDKCDWGMKYSDGLEGESPHVGQVKFLTYIFLADAKIALELKDYDLAIKRCLTARKVGIDLGYAPLAIGFLVEKAITRYTNDCIQDILTCHCLDLETLKYLKAKLNELDSRSKPITYIMEPEQEVMALYASPERIRELLPYVNPENTPRLINAPEDTRKYILEADADFCRRNKTYYDQHWFEIFATLKLPYHEAYIKLKDLGKKTAEDYKENPDAFITMLLCPAVHNIYNSGIQSDTYSNALKTALELYIIKAQTGKFPDNLPPGSPKDLFSGQDFEYEKTTDGFILRCQVKDVDSDEIHEYEFK